MKLKILHISDLHFSENGVAQDNVLNSLSMKIEELCKLEIKPNLLVITGDIAYSGKAAEYDRAREFIDRITKHCEITVDKIFMIPGNHDVDRTKIKAEHKNWWYNFKCEQDLNQVLSSEIALPAVESTTDSYFQFVKERMTGTTEIGKYSEYVSKV